MRAIKAQAHIFLAAILTTAASASQQPYQPFQPIETAKPLARRQGCIANFYSCVEQGAAFNGVCCQNGQTCALDANNSPACCPQNAVCTGTAPPSFVTPSPTLPVSYVPNQYFSFPYIVTSFDNPQACSQAVDQCSANNQACTAALNGPSGPGVTVIVPGGGGTTIAGNGGAGNLGPTSASSICSSLSSVACRNLQVGLCTNVGIATGGFFFGTGNAGARPTPCVGLAAGMAVAAGVAGLGFAHVM